MKIVITEEQYNKLLTESYKERIFSILLKGHDFSKKIIQDASRQLGFDFRFLLSYGAGIGALLTPVYNYLENNFTDLTNEQIAGLAVMAVGVVFFENKDLKRQEEEILDSGLDSELRDAINYTNTLKNKFTKLLKLLGMSVHRASNIISYSFLIPVLNILIEVVTKHGVESTQFSMLVESLLTSGIIAVTGVALKDVLFKAAQMIKRR